MSSSTRWDRVATGRERPGTRRSSRSCWPAAATRSADLTAREREVLALMAEGRSNAAIAATLVVGEGAVAKHINSIFTKLRLPPADRDHRRVLAVLRYLGAE